MMDDYGTRVYVKKDITRKVRRLCLDNEILLIGEPDYSLLHSLFRQRYGMPQITKISTIERAYRKIRAGDNRSLRDEIGVQANMEAFAR